MQSVARGQRVLCCAPSNIAVDNLVERITAAATFNASHSVKATAPPPSSSLTSPSSFHFFRCIRLGHPARLAPAVLSHSLDSVVATSDGAKISRDIEVELSTTAKAINSTRDREERKSLRTQWKSLQRELRTRQRKAVRDALDSCPVICATLIGAASSSCSAYRYDVVIIDEAAQAIEVACLIPILLARQRLILAGDHHQLGPVVKSKEAVQGGLGLTLMDRIAKRPDSTSLIQRLNEQYRMNEDIMTWSSREFYDAQLTAPEEVRARRLTQLQGVREADVTLAPLVFIDTAGCDMQEDDDDEEQGATTTSSSPRFAQSKSNSHEVQLVLRHIRLLLSVGVPLSSITILSPYLAQISLLRDVLLPHYPTVEVGTIDSMQGRENDAVLISMVRSNPSHTVGFLSDARRINVAITRARRQVCIIGDSDTLSRDAFLKRLVDYVADNPNAEYRSAVEYQQAEERTETTAAARPASESASTSAPSAAPRAAKPSVAAEPTPSAAAATVAGASKAEAVEGSAASVVEEFDRRRIVRSCEDVRTGALQSFTFPASLSVEDRRMVHEVADEVGQGELSHQSEGKGHRRVITLRRMPPPASAAPPPLPTPPAASDAVSTSPPSAAARAESKAVSRAISSVEPPSARQREEARLAAVNRMERNAKPQQRMVKPSQPAVQPKVTKQAQVAHVAVPAAVSGAFDQLRVDGDEEEEDMKEGKEERQGSHQPQQRQQEQRSHTPPAHRAAEPLSHTDGINSQALQPGTNGPSNPAAAHPSPPATKKSKASGLRAGGTASGAAAAAADDDDDLDGFLNSLLKGVTVCASPQCSRRVMDSAVCPHCHLGHCLSHANPILHGCALDAKEAALARDMRTFQASKQGRSVSGLKADARQQLAQRLQSKAEGLRKAGEAAPRKKKAVAEEKKR